MKIFILFLLIVPLGSCQTDDSENKPSEQTTASKLKKELETVLKDFYKTIREKGFSAPYETDITIKNTEAFIFFQEMK